MYLDMSVCAIGSDGASVLAEPTSATDDFPISSLVWLKRRWPTSSQREQSGVVIRKTSTLVFGAGGVVLAGGVALGGGVVFVRFVAFDAGGWAGGERMRKIARPMMIPAAIQARIFT